MKYDLKNIRLLLKALGNPHEKIKFIHIAGTNGKGGTASSLASILTEHGLKTGLFTSPHILRFNERIRINGKAISDRYIKEFLNTNKRIIQKIKPSFFEVNTAMAFKYFADKKVDVAVVEAGLGGRLDSTNIIRPELAIITQIGIDHTEYLGNTLKSIAREKIGIVKPGADVIVSDESSELKRLFEESIEKEHLFFIRKHSNYRIIKGSSAGIQFRSQIDFSKKKHSFTLSSPLPGVYQIKNINTAILASMFFLSKEGIRLSQKSVEHGIAKLKDNSGYRGRFELIRTGGIDFIFDVSHNPAGISAAISNFNKTKTDVTIFGMMDDKDYKTAIGMLIKKSNKLIFTQPKYKRSLPAKTLFDFALKTDPKEVGKYYLSKNVKEAVRVACDMAVKKGTVLIIGSFFLVSEAIRALKIQKLFA